ncbi:bifunctional 3-(3-hydroxy-phenyl)propionate/3-hydroxycinnamic acid hydroxylase MhpA [Nocardia sp. NPDC004722]
MGKQDFAVIVIGCGPVGKVLALRIASAGFRVALVDKRADAYRLPRAVTHDAEIARILQAIGMAPGAISDVTQPYDGIYRWENANQDLLLEVDWAGSGESGWYNTYFFHQPALEDRLDERLRLLPNVVVLRGWEYTGHTDVGDGVAVTVRRGRETLELGARYLIGADGAASRVRAAIGADWRDNQYFSDWLVVDVVPGADAPPLTAARQICDPARPHTMVPGGPGRRRWEFMRLPGEQVAEIDRPEFAWALLSQHGFTPENSVLERHTTYRFQAGWATTWRSGRALIAGDAAHLMPPFAGQGMCTGLRDAMNLSWKLRAVLSGVANDEVLDTYAAERIPHTAATVEFSVRLGKLICVTDPADARRRDERMLVDRARRPAPVSPPRPRLGPGIHHGAHGGTLSIQGFVRDGQRAARRLDDVLGGPGALLVRDGRLLAGLTDLDFRRLSAAGIRPCVLDGGGYVDPCRNIPRLSDINGGYRTWFRTLTAEAVLIRPDFYVYDTAAGETGVRLMVRQFLAVLEGARVAL